MDLIYSKMFLMALISTCLFETFCLFLLIRFVFKINKDKVTNLILIFAGIFASFATLPYVWFIFPELITNRSFYILISEIFAVIIEAILYYFIFKISFKKALLISFICNLFSFILGLFIF